MATRDLGYCPREYSVFSPLLPLFSSSSTFLSPSLTALRPRSVPCELGGVRFSPFPPMRDSRKGSSHRDSCGSTI